MQHDRPTRVGGAAGSDVWWKLRATSLRQSVAIGLIGVLGGAVVGGVAAASGSAETVWQCAMRAFASAARERC